MQQLWYDDIGTKKLMGKDVLCVTLLQTFTPITHIWKKQVIFRVVHIIFSKYVVVNGVYWSILLIFFIQIIYIMIHEA